MPLFHRFWSKVERGPGCWMWKGSYFRTGYGQFNVNRFPVLAHRVAWALWNGRLPGSWQVLHRCDNPGCVRPDHLWRGTQRDNIQDSLAKGRNSYRNRTHCPRGHPYAGTNLYVSPRGHRACRACRPALPSRKYAYRKRHRKEVGKCE